MPASRTIALIALSAVASIAGAQAPAIHVACYVPLTGTVYRIGTADTRPSCSSASHVQFSWTDGASAVRVTDPFSGDVGGTFANTSVRGLLGRPLASTPPFQGMVLTFTGSAWTPADLPPAPPVVFPLSVGDVAGTYPTLAVTGLRGRPLASTPPLSGQVLRFNGTAWAPSDLPVGANAVQSGAPALELERLRAANDDLTEKVRALEARLLRLENRKPQ